MKAKTKSPALLVACGFLAAIFVAALGGYVWMELAMLYLGASAMSFLLHAFDKSAARKRWQRIPENTLHVLSLLGGWPGGLAGQQIFRHKTVKQPFRSVFWGTVLLNVGVLAWLLWSRGGGILSAPRSW